MEINLLQEAADTLKVSKTILIYTLQSHLQRINWKCSLLLSQIQLKSEKQRLTLCQLECASRRVQKLVMKLLIVNQLNGCRRIVKGTVAFVTLLIKKEKLIKKLYRSAMTQYKHHGALDFVSHQLQEKTKQ